MLMFTRLHGVKIQEAELNISIFETVSNAYIARFSFCYAS